MKSSTWFVFLLEIFAYVLLIGRLLHDSVTQAILTEQMISFLTNASDIFELFSLFEEQNVIEDTDMTRIVLFFWTFSFFQFIPIWASYKLGETEKEHKEKQIAYKKHYMPDFCHCRCICLEDENKKKTSVYETAFAWIFQDCPFLILRLYIMFHYNLYTQSLVFYSFKNAALSVLLAVKVVTLLRGRKSQDKICCVKK